MRRSVCAGLSWQGEAGAHARVIGHDPQRRGRGDDVFTVPSPLPDDPTRLRQLLLAAIAEIERQRLQIAALQRNRFGRRSEQLNDETLAQGLEDWNNRLPNRRPGWKRCRLPWRRPRLIARTVSQPGAIVVRCRRTCRG